MGDLSTLGGVGHGGTLGRVLVALVQSRTLSPGGTQTAIIIIGIIVQGRGQHFFKFIACLNKVC